MLRFETYRLDTDARAAANSVRLLWPTNDPAFHLQYVTNLTTTNWTAAVEAPVVIGTNNVVTNTASGTEKYYRLMRQEVLATVDFTVICDKHDGVRGGPR